MNPILDQFLLEGRELVERATDDLLRLERHPDDAGLVDSIFRAFHTLKGSADIVGLPALSLALHAGEDALSALRGGEARGRAPLIADAVLSLLGQVGDWLDAIEREGALPPDAGSIAGGLAAGLRAVLADERESGPAVPAAALPDWVGPLLADPAVAARAARGGLSAISYEPLVGAFFNGDDPFDLMRRLPGLVALDIVPRAPWPESAAFDPFACNLSIRALAEGEPAALAPLFRLVADQVAIVPVAGTAAEEGDDPATAILKAQIGLLATPGPAGALAGRIGSAGRVAVNVLRHGGRQAAADAVAAALTEALARSDGQLLVAAIEAALRSAPAPVPAGAVAEPRAGGRVLRVEAARVDALADLAGELIVARNGFAHLVGRAGAALENAALARALAAQQAVLDRLTTALHASVMQVRLLPVAQMFRRFPRLVRDGARELGKDVELVIGGEDSEADKGVIETLYEPLLHIVRNALDHGCETPEERRAAGKPPRATLSLRAARSGEGIVIEVADDGRGIDPEAVRRTAVTRGLMTAEAAGALSADEAVQLIFLPGFSTASRVSTLSGRGVGMDAARMAITRMGGRIALESRPGVGTTVRLILPLSLVMTRIMTVSVGGEAFGIPLEPVVETVRLPRDRILSVRSGRVVVLRDRAVPVVGLRDLLGLLPSAEPAEAHILVAATESGAVGIEVDGFGERFDAVMKPLDGLLSGMPDIIGTTLTGDGRVLVVLDIKGMAG